MNLTYLFFQIWDLRAGKLMTEFADHGGPVHDVEFHPHEFLLASASRYFELNDLIIMFEILFGFFRDRSVKFWDLESFQLVSTSDKDTGPVR